VLVEAEEMRQPAVVGAALPGEVAQPAVKGAARAAMQPEKAELMGRAAATAEWAAQAQECV
jgi:hypothetical protein